MGKIFKSFSMFLMILKSGLSILDESKEINLIVDLLKTYHVPTAVTAFVCWEPRIKMELINEMVDFKPPKTIKFVNERSNLKEATPKDVLIVADLNCQGIESFFKQVYDKKIFNSPYRWLIFEEPTNKAVTVPPQLVDFDIMLNSEMIIARRMANESFDMYMIYKRKAKSDWLIEHYGSWSREFRLQKSKLMDLVIPIRRRDLALQPVPATFNINDNLTGYDVQNPDPIILSSRHSVTRWAYYLLDIYDFINATKVIVFSNDWGYIINGTMNGIVGSLAREEAEFSGTPVFITKERMVYCHYLVNPAKTSVQFVFRGPPLSYENNLFVLPFTGGVWCVLAVFIVFMTAVIYVNARWERKKLEILDYDKDKIIAWNLNLSDVTLMVIGAVSQQGTYTELRGPIGRAVTFILLLAFLFLFTAYSANIVALLQSTSKQIRTLSDLLNSKLELGAENTAYNIHFFKTATEPIRKAIYETKIAPRGAKPKFMPVEEGVQRMQKYPFAFNMDTGPGYGVVEKYFYEHEKCGLQEIPYIAIQRPWMVIRRGSPYVEVFKIGYFRLQEHGMGERANTKVFTKKPQCTASGGIFESVNIVDSYPPFLLLLYGMIISCGLLGLEIWVHRQKMKMLAVEEMQNDGDIVSTSSFHDTTPIYCE